MLIGAMAETAQLALDTILQKPAKGIPSWMINVMEHSHIERVAGVPRGSYKMDPEKTYIAFQRAAGTCLLDQYIPENPLTMGDYGYEGAERGATTGAEKIVVDGMLIDSPEAVVEHMEKFVFPALRRSISEFDEDARVREIIENERNIQDRLGPTILKSGYGFIDFPHFAYGTYGYENYFIAYALYPEIIERHFSLQADLALLNNRAAARAYREGGLPLLYRLDHDMADSRGTLVRIESLDRIWFPHFARCLEPMLKTDVRMIWHCDGNLMQMVPRLLEVGIRGFQGFQYEDGMDYEKICSMKTKDGEDLIIIGGVSVTRTLPWGTPDDVKREMAWLVERGPKTGLFLGCSSSVTPGVPWENIETLIEGFKYYRERGRR
ncbi:MAG: uroporphyrinogen decarboxylase family protein [bacterium]